ncbi:hypothetical protein ILYODFUR_021454 [Ilyodon furcidens]|uniref:Uncharacterized protein n=1 Tax=Ilyodon furcidens TaxID=33524 RepID=A0ABV0U096_9TELE
MYLQFSPYEAEYDETIQGGMEQEYIWEIRYLSSSTIPSYVFFTVQKTSLAERQRPLLWAVGHLAWTITHWEHGLWSEKSVFQMAFGKSGAIRERSVQPVVSNQALM